jgi:chitodextrinase
VHLFAGTTSATPVTASFLQVNVQQLAKINYTFTGLTTATHYNFTAVARDIAGNDSDVSVALGVTTP